MKVGLSLPQAGEDGDGATWPQIAALARQAEAGGVDSLWLCDHFFYRRPTGTQIGYHEAWTLLSALAAITDRVELGTLVLATSFRPPALLAKMAATADDVAHGRLVLGLGCGWYEPEYRAYGYPFDHRVGRFEEAMEVIVPLLRGERVTFEGRWMRVEDAVVLPSPRRRIPLLVAAGRERMLRLTARFADQWQTAWYGAPDEEYAAAHAAFVAACQAENRDPASFEISVGVNVGGDDDAKLALDPNALADGLSAWAEMGVGHVQLGAFPVTGATVDVVLDGIARLRERS